MTGGRFLRYLVVWLLLMPVVMAATDTAQHTAGGSVTRIPDLREGERFEYDVVLTSEFHDLNVRVPGYMVVEVGHVQERNVAGDLFRALPVTMIKGWGPWDDYASLDGVISGMNADWEDFWEITTKTSWYDVDSGAVLEHQEQKEGGVVHVSSDGRTPREFIRNETHYAPGSSKDPVFRWGMAPGMRLATPFDAFSRTMGQLLQAELPNIESGALDGVPVVNAKTWGHAPPARQQGDHATCSLFYPELWYQDFGLAEHIRNRPVWLDQKSDVWVSNDHALPLLQECRLTIHHVDQGGTLIEDLHFAMVLSDHEPGGEPVRVDYDLYSRTGIVLSGPLEARAPEHPGVPVSLDGLTPFALTDAYQVVLTSSDPDLSSFVRAAGGEPIVERAEYQHIEPEGEGGPILPPEAEGLLSGLISPDGQEPPVATLVWTLGLAGEPGSQAEVVVSADVSENGDLLETRVDSMHERSTFEGRSLPDPAARIVPLEELAAHHASLTGEQELESFALYWSRDDEAYRFTVPRPQGSASTPEGREYSATNGALKSQWDRTFTERSQPAQNPYASLSAVTVDIVPKVQLGTAAIASGVVLTLIFALTYFSDAVLRFLVHGTMPLYAKVQRDKALDHPKRRAIHDLVTAEPGVSSNEVRTRMKIGHGTTMFHLATLEHVGLLSSRKVGRERSWFVPGQIHHRDQARATLLAKPAVRRVYEAVGAHPGAHQAGLADLLGVRASSVRFHLKRLEEAGLVRGIQEGRRIVYFLEAAPHQPRRETAAPGMAAT